MKARSLLAVALTAMTVASALPATAAPAMRTLTVRGTPNAYTEVTFTRPLRLETAFSTRTPPRFETAGTYVGAYLEPVRGDGPAAGTGLLPALRAHIPFPLGVSGWLPAGRYRVHLLADSPATVRIAAAGLRRDTTVTTRTRSDIRGGWVSRGVVGVVAPADRTIVPFTVRSRRTLTIAASQHESTGFYGRREECVRPRSDGLTPCLDGNNGRGWYWGAYPFTYTFGAGGPIPAGRLAPGEYEAEFFDATVGLPHAYRTFVLTLN